MEWIVEAETLSDLIDHGRYYVSPRPLIRCKDCKYYDGRPCGIVDWYNTADDFCSRAEWKFIYHGKRKDSGVDMRGEEHER